MGLEAIYFDKEVISLDYEQRDYQGFVKDGIAFPARDGKELNSLLISILSGQKKLDPEKKNAFVQYRAFKIDGKASQRVMDCIVSSKNLN